MMFCRHRPMGGLFTAHGVVATVILIFLTSCATTPRHQFAEPTQDWESRSGQLLYRNGNTTLIGEVLVRFSKIGDFELTFSKGPGVTLLNLRQDAGFAQLKGALAGPGWLGEVDKAPPPLRGWLGVRDQLIHSRDRRSIRHAVGQETFLFRF